MEVLIKSRLKEFLRERGISQRFLARQLGFHPNTMSLIANGKSIPSYRTMLSISHILGIPIEEIWSSRIREKQI